MCLFLKVVLVLLRGSCWYPSAVILFSSAGTCGSRPWFHPLTGYLLRRRCLCLVPHFSRCGVLYFLYSVSDSDWVPGICLKNNYWIQPMFVRLQHFSSIACSRQRKLQTLISCYGNYRWIVLPCKAPCHFRRTELSHWSARGIYQLASMSLSYRSFADF